MSANDEIDCNGGFLLMSPVSLVFHTIVNSEIGLKNVTRTNAGYIILVVNI